MKRLAVGCVLTLASLALMAFPAQASPVLSAADQEFLASLATPVPTLAAKRPIAEKALCSAAVDCGSGHSVSCSSSVSRTHCSAVDRDCPGQQGSVTCDGVTTTCPPCPIAIDPCPALSQQCTDSCGPCGVRFFQCSPYICQCNVCD